MPMLWDSIIGKGTGKGDCRDGQVFCKWKGKGTCWGRGRGRGSIGEGEWQVLGKGNGKCCGRGEADSYLHPNVLSITISSVILC